MNAYTLSHPHIMKIIGVTYRYDNSFSIVMPWLEYGSASKYLTGLIRKRKPNSQLAALSKKWVSIVFACELHRTERETRTSLSDLASCFCVEVLAQRKPSPR